MRREFVLPEVCFGRRDRYLLIQEALSEIGFFAWLDAPLEYEENFIEPVGLYRMLWIEGKLFRSGRWSLDANFIESPNLEIKMKSPPPALAQLDVIGGHIEHARYGHFHIEIDGKTATTKVSSPKKNVTIESEVDEVDLLRKIQRLEKQNDPYFDLIQLQSPDRIERHKTDNSRIVIESFDIAKRLESSRI